MPQIPVFKKRTQPTKPTGPTPVTLARPDIPQADIASVRRPGEDLAAIGAATAKVAQYLQRVADIQKVTSRETELSRQIRDIQQRAENDPNLDKGQDYLDEINALREGVSEGITDPATRLQFQSRINQSADIANLNIQNTFRAKLVDKSKTDLNDFVDEAREAYFDAGNRNQRVAIKKSALDRIDLMATTGVISKEAALGRKLTLTAEWADLELKRDLQRAPELAERKMALGYYDLNAKQKINAKAKIEEAKKKAEKERDKALLEGQHEVEGATAAELLSGQLTEEKLETLELQTGISPEMANVMFAVKISPETVNAVTDDAKYIKLFNKLFSYKDDDFEAIKKHRIEILATHALGDLTQKDTNFLIQRTVDPTFTDTEEKANWNISWGMIKDYALNVAGPPGPLIRKLLSLNENNQLKDNDLITTTKEIIKNDAMKNQPSSAALDDMPNGLAAQDEDLYINTTNKTQVKPTHVWRNGKLIKVQ